MSPTDLTAQHLKAARALLGWGQGDLAEAAGIAPSSIKRFEADPEGLARASAKNVKAVHSALSDAGIEFFNGGQPGARLVGKLIDNSGAD